MTRHAPALLAALALTLGASLAVKATPQAPASAPAAVDFVRDVQPILEKQCSECHGPKKAKGKRAKVSKDAPVDSATPAAAASLPKDVH